MKRWFVRAALVAVVLELMYLAVANLALNLPLTQTLVNRAQPERFAVYWDKAWTWYPFRVHVRGVSANGQSSSQQWQLDAPAASGAVSVLPLLWRSVHIRDVSARDIAYRQRPRPRPDGKYASLREFFPSIRDRRLDDTPPPRPGKKRRSWNVSVINARARGSHRFWIYQAQGRFRGTLYTDLRYRTPKGPLSLENGAVDIELEDLVLNGGQPVAGKGRLIGRVEMAPFLPRENRGVAALAFLKAALEVDIETDSLAFLNLYLRNLHGMEVDGVGQLRGRIAVEDGKLKPGTDLAVSAGTLGMNLLDHRVEGAGNIHLNVTPDAADTARAVIDFSSFEGFPVDSRAPLFTGEGLSVDARGATAFMSLDKATLADSYLSVDIPSVRVPDIARFQRYLPAHLALKLHGGQGELQARAVFADMGLDAHLRLMSQDTDLGFQDYRFNTALDVALEAACPAIGVAGIDITGTYFKLDEATLSRRMQEASTPLHASLRVEKGKLKLDLPKGTVENWDPKQPWAGLKGKDLALLLGTEETLVVRGSISDLKWLNLLLETPYDLAVKGEGELQADVNLAAGWPAPGTRLDIQPEKLTVEVLDYVARGDGRIELAVQKGGPRPDVKLSVDINDARFKRRGEGKAYIENVAMALRAMVRGVRYDRPGGDATLGLKILSASVKDMSVFNRYLPPNSPVEFLRGGADLAADIDLTPKSAGGFVKMKTGGMQLQVAGQEISGKLTANITLAGGVPEDMDFDISGSTLVLEKVRISGDRKHFDQPDWRARLELEKGRAVWKEPVLVEVEADLALSDTRPLVAIIASHKDKPEWLEKLLTVEDIHGEARMTVTRDRVTVPYAFAASKAVDVGAKGSFSASTRDGVFYARFKNLHALLKIKNDHRDLDVYRARKKFDAYTPGRALP